MIFTMDLYMDVGEFRFRPEDTLRQVLEGISIANIKALPANGSLNLYDKKGQVVGAGYWKSVEPIVMTEELVTGLGTPVI